MRRPRPARAPPPPPPHARRAARRRRGRPARPRPHRRPARSPPRGARRAGRRGSASPRTPRSSGRSSGATSPPPGRRPSRSVARRGRRRRRDARRCRPARPPGAARAARRSSSADAVEPAEPVASPAITSGCLSKASSGTGANRSAAAAAAAEQQGARRRLRERPAGAVVGLDPPAPQMRRDAAGERAVGRDQGGGAPRLLQRLAQRDARSPAPPRPGRRARARARRSAGARRAAGPAICAVKRGGRHGVGDGAAARRRRVAAAAPAPALDLAAADAHPVEQQLQVELRMGLDRAAGGGRSSRSGSCGPSASHSSAGHGEIERRAGPPCPRSSRATTPSRRATAGAAVVMPAAQTKPGRRRSPPAPRDRVEQPVAPVGEVDPAALGEHRRPVGEDQPQLVERLLPVDRQIGQIGGEAAQARGIDLLDQQLIERAGEILGEPQRLGGVGADDGAGPAGRAASAAAPARSPAGSAPRPSGSSMPPIRSSSSGSPTGTSRGSSRPPPERRTNASWIARAARLLGTSTMPLRQPGLLRARTARSARRRARRRRRGAAGW